MIANYSVRQLRLVQSAMTISGLFSAIGSSLVMFHAINKRHSIQHRILLGLSAFDLISSLGNVVFPFAFHSLDRMPGLDCTIETSIQLLGNGAVLYNLALSIYYVLCIVCLLPQERIAKQWEPVLHIFCTCFPIACVIAALSLGDVANPNVYHSGCHINAYPRACDEKGSEVECERGGDGRAFRFLIGSTAVPILTTWAALFINSAIIVWVVYRQEKKRTRYDPSASTTRTIGCCGTCLPEPERSLSSKMAHQALQWVGCFSLTYMMALIMWSISTIDLERTIRGKYFPIIFMMELCWPLQGFFDAIVYFRPKYILWRTNGSLNKIDAIRWTLCSLQRAPTRHPPKHPVDVAESAEKGMVSAEESTCNETSSLKHPVDVAESAEKGMVSVQEKEHAKESTCNETSSL